MIMRNLIKSILFCILLLIIAACENTNYGEKIYDVAKLELGENISGYNKIIIIPGSGCTGCISNAEKFFLENHANTEIKFIFTHYYSLKNMMLRLGGFNNVLQPNVFIDDNDIFYFLEYEEHIYPYVIEIKNNKVISQSQL